MTHTLAARVHARGITFPSHAEGTLYSRHDSAVNITIADTSELVSLVSESDGMTVSSALVSVVSGAHRLGTLPIPNRCDVSIEPGRIRFGSRLSIELVRHPGEISYDGRLDPAPPIDLRTGCDLVVRRLIAAICDSGADRGFASIAPALHAARALRANGCGAPSSAHTIGNCFAREAWRVLAPAVGGREVPAALARLVGLGEGLTPSGDDFVTGVLAAWSLIGAGPVPETVRAQIGAATGQTTRPGATIVLQALRGCFPAYLVRFAVGLRDVSAGRIAAAVDQAARHGHTSGIDTVTGFAFGLTTGRSQAIVVR